MPKKNVEHLNTGYKKEYDKIAYQMSLLGATAEEMATAFGISQPTIYDWREWFPSFDKAIREGQIVADAKVAHSLYKRAVGYTVKETKIVPLNGMIRKVPVLVHIHPDVTAAKLWLCARRKTSPMPHEKKKAVTWTDSKEITGPEGAPLFEDTKVNKKLRELTDSQIDALVALVGEDVLSEEGEN